MQFGDNPNFFAQMRTLFLIAFMQLDAQNLNVVAFYIRGQRRYTKRKSNHTVSQPLSEEKGCEYV